MNTSLMRLDVLQRIHDLETLLQVKPGAAYDSGIHLESARLCLGIRLSFKESNAEFDRHCDSIELLVDELLRSAISADEAEVLRYRIHEHLGQLAEMVRPRA